MKNNAHPYKKYPVKAIIIDDEQHARENLLGLLSEHCPSVHIAGLAASVEEGETVIKKIKPDLIFLDIKLSRSSGFQLLEMVGNMDFEVIFITAYDNYAIRAIKFSALDYILKPVNPDELKAAVMKMEKRIEQDQKSHQLKLLIENFNRERFNSKIAVRTNEKLEFLAISSIVRLQGESNYTKIHLEGGGSLLVSKSLIEFEELLSELGFFRVHKTHLVNLNCIKSYHKSKDSCLILADNTNIPVSRRRKAALSEILKRELY